MNANTVVYFDESIHTKTVRLLYLDHLSRSIIEPVRNTGFRQTDHFHLSRATGIDFAKRIVNAESDLNPGLTYDIGYDKLVIGVGSLSNTFGVPGVIENACFLKVRHYLIQKI